MKRKGVSYDVGCSMGYNWRPDFNPRIVHQELEIMKNDLHCNAVRICGLSIDRLITIAEDALRQGLEVWLSPQMWNKSPEKTLKYMSKVAIAAETLHKRWSDSIVLSVGSELTLFMNGIIEGRNFVSRIKNPNLKSGIMAGEHNKPLNDYLFSVNKAVRKEFQGKLTYVSLIFEAVDWNIFDFVGVDHYRIERIKDQYVDMMKPLFAFSKPVVITEFGYATYQGGIGSEGLLGSAGLNTNIIDVRSQFLHQLPLIGLLVRPHLRGNYVRDEAWQVSQLVDQLNVLDKAGVEGAFISQFISQITPYSENPYFDLEHGKLKLSEILR